MRPLVLTMQAFGPYANKEVIDFTKLGNRTMFVISGKTGAGKTTIFDGISFAIYGKASGEDRAGSDMRSHFADDDLLTEVSLQFILRGKTYYIWRSPQQERKKSRGEGTTTVPAKAELYVIVDGEKQQIAANIRDVDEKIQEIMQIDVNQFRQILMIPQGEFRKLLVSDSKDKEGILQRIFHTVLYKKIEETLKERAALLKNQVAQYQNQKIDRMKMIYTEENETLKNLLDVEEINETAVLTVLEEDLLIMKSRIDEMLLSVQEKEKNRNKVYARWVKAKEVIDQFTQKDLLEKRKMVLDGQSAAVTEKQMIIEKAYKAERLMQQEELCTHIHAELEELIKRHDSLKNEILIIQQRLAEADSQYKNEKGKEKEREDAAMYYQKLQGMQEEILAFARWIAELEDLEKREAAVKEKLVKIDFQLSDLLQQEEELKKQKTKLEQMKEKYFNNRLILGTLKNIIDWSSSLIDTRQKLVDLNKSKIEMENKSININSRLHDQKSLCEELEKKWYFGQAAALAHTLESGEACPVCGSTHHPNPANQNGDFPSQSEVKDARSQLEIIENDKKQHDMEMQQLKFDIKLYEEKTEGYVEKLSEYEKDILTIDIVAYLQLKKSELEDLQNEIDRQEIYLSKSDEIMNQLINTEQTIKDITDKKDMLIQEERALEIMIAEKQAMINRLKDSIPDQIQSKDNYLQEVAAAKLRYETLINRLENSQKVLAKIKEEYSSVKGKMDALTSVIEGTKEKMDHERAKFKEMLSSQGFQTYNDYENAKKTSDQISILEQEILSYREEYRSVSDQLQQLVVRLENAEKPDMNKLEDELKTAESIVQLAREVQNKLVNNYEKNSQILESIKKINEMVRDVENEYNLIGHLSEVSRGQNSQRITFERYVLASFLDDILRLSNVRLLKMTSGRFKLLRKKDRSKGNVQSGLELLIFDQYTGQERHVKTLSGGESFKASLSLALGLADVVQEYSGGISLETMFIDEGFGTLDPESLDHAIEALMDIQSSGRLVGIISHVPELKERIDARLEVISTQEGSRTEFVFLQ